MNRRQFVTHTALSVASLFISACSRTDLLRVTRAAASGDDDLLENMARDKADYYTRNPLRFVGDAKAFEAEFKALLKDFKEKIGRVWGDDEKTSKPKEVVKYTQSYQSRSRVDFEKGLIIVETLDRKSPQQSLRSAIVTTLLSPEDPTAIDLFSDREVEVGKEPYLYGRVLDQDGKAIRWEWRANRFAGHVLKTASKSGHITVKGEKQAVRYVEIAMVKGHLNISADKYRNTVLSQARRFGQDPALVYAIMETESSFNPFATSPIPAYGLMQIVPTSAGRDAWRELNKEDGIPTKNYLFQANKNIEMGCAYLHILDSRYLASIKNKQTREHCVIAAYNTGAGNVLKTFHADRDKAAARINSMSAAAVYRKLQKDLPYAETRRYVVKVNTARKKYI